MKRRKRNKLISIIITAVLLLSMTGCYYETRVEKDENTDNLTTNTETSKMETYQEIEVFGESFLLSCTYDTGKYDKDNWHVTEDKSINMCVKTKNLPDGYEVYIEHMHADISLKSTYASLNGIEQDSMDDSSHTVPTNGFYIDDNTHYYNTFAISGYTKEFYEIWGYTFGGYGTMSSRYQRLNESNIIALDIYAEKLHVVYDLNIKKPDNDHFYTVSVESEVLIPVSKNTNTYEVDVLTGEPKETEK